MCKRELGFYKIDKLLILSIQKIYDLLYEIKSLEKKKIQKFLALMNNSSIITHFYSYIYLFNENLMKIDFNNYREKKNK